MADNNYIFPDSEELERIYLERLNNVGKPKSEEPEKPAHNDPIDAHEYKDPEKESPEVFDKMVADIERRRAERSTSYWSDKPADPADESIWLGSGKREKREPEKRPEPARRAELPKEPDPKPQSSGRTKRTIEIKLSEDMQKKMASARGEQPAPQRPAPRPAQQAQPQSRVRPEGEQPARSRVRPEGEQPARSRVRPEGEQPARSRVRPEGEQSARSRVRPEGEQSARSRVRPEGEQPARSRVRPEGEQPARSRVRPEGEQSARSRVRPEGEQSASRQRPSGPSDTTPPRRKKKKPRYKRYETEFSFLNAALCMLLVFGVGIALIVMKRESGLIESEKRNYLEKPEFSVSSWFKGEYTENMAKYYTDTIPNRESLKGFADSFSKLFGINLDDVQVKNIKAVQKETLDSEAANTTTSKVTLYTGPAETTTAQTAASGEQPSGTTGTTTKVTLETKKHIDVPDEGEWAGNVILTGSGSNVRAMPAFYGQFSVGADYASVLNDYKKMLGDKVNVFNLYCPLSSAYYMPENMRDQFTDQHDAILNVGRYLENVINVDAYNELANHADEYIYSRTDHHWQPLGAYYAMKIFTQEAGLGDTFKDLSTYEKNVIDGFCGTMYAFSDYVQALKDNPDQMIYYKPDNNDQLEVNYWNSTFQYINENKGHSLFFDWASGGNAYGAVLGDDLDICEVKTPVHNGRVLVVLKDSYANATIPFLTHSFEKIYVVDFRYADISMVQFAKTVGATDMIFTVSISGGHTQTHIDRIRADM
ncbi:DHHW protein [Ruminococcaceae bacterium FB2012]|nr:DHHW protein [Ruminococcaceae bacterium FB2012]